MSPQPPSTDAAAAELVTFRLGGALLAVPTAELREVLEPVHITRVPGAAPFVPGLLNVRGAVVPLADLRIPLRMPPRDSDDNARILVLELPLAGQLTVVGILADSVHEVIRIAPDQREAIPPVGTRWSARHVAAVSRWAGEFLTLPDLPAIFADYLAGPVGRTLPFGATGAHSPSETEPSRCA